MQQHRQGIGRLDRNIMLIRLQKFLAEAQVASRRKSEEIIAQGRVTVNGEVADTPGVKVDAEKDIICVDGKLVKKAEKMVYIILNKPEGCVTTVKDQFNRKTVMDYVSDVRQRIYPIGRLDYNTSGLLILTNDGDLAYRLTHPKHNIEKTYIACVEKTPSSDDMESFRRGIIIDGRKTAPAYIEIIGKNKLEIKIHEGRNRQVRKMCEAIGSPVITLERVAIGNLKLDNLDKGKYRHLSVDEIEYIKGL